LKYALLIFFIKGTLSLRLEIIVEATWSLRLPRGSGARNPIVFFQPTFNEFEPSREKFINLPLAAADLLCLFVLLGDFL